MRKIVLPALALLLIAVLAGGCANGQKLKQQLTDAYGKQTAMTNYSFSGKAEIAWDDQSEAAKNPLTASLLSVLRHSTIAWQGVSADDPVRLEAKLTVAPTGASTTWEIPLLIKDNKIYVHLPVVNQQGEYLTADLQDLSALANQDNPLTAEKIRQSAQLTSAVMKQLIEALDPKWFKRQKAGDDASLDTVTVHVEGDDWPAFAGAFAQQIPQLAAQLQSAGYPVTDQMAAQWQAELQGSTLNKPFDMTVSTDENGFVRKETIDLDVSMRDQDQQTHSWSVQLQNSYDSINQNPPFTMEVPTDTKPLLDILKYLNPGAAGSAE